MSTDYCGLFLLCPLHMWEGKLSGNHPGPFSSKRHQIISVPNGPTRGRDPLTRGRMSYRTRKLEVNIPAGILCLPTWNGGAPKAKSRLASAITRQELEGKPKGMGWQSSGWGGGIPGDPCPAYSFNWEDGFLLIPKDLSLKPITNPSALSISRLDFKGNWTLTLES